MPKFVSGMIGFALAIGFWLGLRESRLMWPAIFAILLPLFVSVKKWISGPYAMGIVCFLWGLLGCYVGSIILKGMG